MYNVRNCAHISQRQRNWREGDKQKCRLKSGLTKEEHDEKNESVCDKDPGRRWYGERGRQEGDVFTPPPTFRLDVRKDWK